VSVAHDPSEPALNAEPVSYIELVPDTELVAIVEPDYWAPLNT
jgi:hypothetical protein